MKTVQPDPEAVARLAVLFHRNGYVRRASADRRAEEGASYKKGAEVRLVAESPTELAEIQQLLRRAGFRVARPFAHARQWRQPVYGVPAVARFLALVGPAPGAEAGAAPDPVAGRLRTAAGIGYTVGIRSDRGASDARHKRPR